MDQKHILVVDDEPDLLEVVATVLKTAGYRVSGAAEGAAALRIARTDRPDLAVVDLLMPGLDGYAFLGMVKRDSAMKFPVIVVSGRVGEKDARRALDAGAAAFLPKPLDRKKLLEHVAQLLQPEA